MRNIEKLKKFGRLVVSGYDIAETYTSQGEYTGRYRVITPHGEVLKANSATAALRLVKKLSGGKNAKNNPARKTQKAKRTARRSRKAVRRTTAKRRNPRKRRSNPLPALVDIGSGILTAATGAIGAGLGSQAFRKKKKNPRGSQYTAMKMRMKVGRRNVEGFLDGSGTFHPIRGTEGYSPHKGGDVRYYHGGKRPKKGFPRGKKRKNPARRNPTPTHAVRVGTHRRIGVGSKREVHEAAHYLRGLGVKRVQIGHLRAHNNPMPSRKLKSKIGKEIDKERRHYYHTEMKYNSIPWDEMDRRKRKKRISLELEMERSARRLRELENEYAEADRGPRY